MVYLLTLLFFSNQFIVFFLIIKLNAQYIHLILMAKYVDLDFQGNLT